MNMDHMNILGIDPGCSGGLVLLDPTGRIRQGISIKAYTDRELFLALGDIKDFHTAPVTAYMELVHSRPTDGGKQAFAFGQNYGKLKMALTALSIPWMDVRPQEWQLKLSLGKTGLTYAQRKKFHRQKAEQFFPNDKITNDIADAALIAIYGWRDIRGL